MITIATELLKKAVGTVGNAVDARIPIPILAYVLCELDTEQQRLTLTGTNLEQTITARIPCDADDTHSDDTPARWTLRYDKLRAIISNTRAQQVRLSIGEQRATLTAGSARFQLITLPATDYPEPPEHPRKAITIEGATLRRAIVATVYAAATPKKDARHFLCGIHFELDGNTITLVATDGHRMHVATVRSTSAQTANIIVPRNTAITIDRLIPDEDITLQLGEHDLIAELGDITIHTKLVDGEYPDWRPRVPRGQRARARVNAPALQQSIIAACVLSNEEYRSIKLTVATSGEHPGIDIQSINTIAEQANDHIDATVEGETLDVGFNAGYLVQAIDTITDTDADITITDTDAAIIRGQDPDTYAVVMAVRL